MLLDVELDHDVDHHANVEAKIIRMANQIATYFDSRPAPDRASGIADHINDFWEPRMRIQLFDLLARRSEAFKQSVVESAQFIHKPTH